MNFFCIFIKLIFFSFLSYSLVFANQKMTDNFNNNPEQRWMFFADTVMGGRSSGDVVFNKLSNNNYAHLSGLVTTENNGGFIQIRKKVSGLNNSVQTIQLKAKGNNEIYHIFLRTSGTILPWQYYKAEFKVTNNWKKINIPISKFERSSSFLSKLIKPNTIKSIGLVAFGRNFEADLYVSEISFQ